MRFKNISKHTVTVECFNIECEPNQECEVPDAYAWPERAANGSRKPSVIECRAPQLIPANDKDYKVWLKVPRATDHTRKDVLPTVAQLIAEGLPPAAAEILSAKRAAEETRK